MRGTWQTTDSGGGGKAVLLIAGVLLLAGSGAAEAVSAAFVALVIALAVVVVTCVAGLGAYLVYRARHETAPLVREIAPPLVRQVPAAERPAIEAPRELHLHFHGLGPAEAAEILRRQQAGQ